MKKTRWFAIVSLLVILPLAAGQVLAASTLLNPTHVDEFSKGDDFLISRVEGTMRNFTAITYNDDLQEYLVVWSDGRAGDSFFDIYGQLISSDGTPGGDNFVIRDEPATTLMTPDVAYDTSNQHYLVVWYDQTEEDVEAQFLNDDGSLNGPAINVAEGNAGDKRRYPAVAFQPIQDEFLVVYEGGALGDMNIYARRLNSAGGIGVTEYTISSAPYNQSEPDISVDPSAGGDFLIVWQDARSNIEDEIWGTIMYSTWILGPEFVISTSTEYQRISPAVAFNPAAGSAGEWLVTYSRFEVAGAQIGGSRVTAAGALIGDEIDICIDDQAQLQSDVAYNAYGDNQWLVVWEDNRTDVAHHEVYGRLVDVNGVPLGGSFAISNPADNLTDPAVASSSTQDGYLVVYPDYETFDINGQRVLTSGMLDGAILTLSTPGGMQRLPSVAYNSQDREYLVVWHDKRAGNMDIWGQRLSVDGALLGASFAMTTDLSDQRYPTVAYNLDTNQYLVAWEDSRNPEGDIYGQLINADGSLNGSNIILAAFGVTGRHSPNLAFNPISGEFLVVFTFEAENNNIRGRRLDATGSPAALEFNIATGTSAQDSAKVACRTMEPGGGDCLVVWVDDSGIQLNIQGQRLDQNGNLLGGLDICTQDGSQLAPRVAYNPDDDRYLITWQDTRDHATQGVNIYGRQVGGDGSFFDEIAISTAAGGQYGPTIAYASGPGNFIVAWDDGRNAATADDIYGQRVSGTGALLGTQADSNEPLYAGAGDQESAFLAWAGNDTNGLLVWDDYRNGTSNDVYGMLLSSMGHTVFLPLVIRE